MSYPETPSKPIQTALQAIREAVAATLTDGTQGPLLIAALKTALGLPANVVETSSTSVNLSDAHSGAVLELLTADTTVTIRAQSSYAWQAKAMVTIRSEHGFSLAAASGVEVNGETAETWTCEAWPKAITLHRRGADSWGLTGAATVAA